MVPRKNNHHKARERNQWRQQEANGTSRPGGQGRARQESSGMVMVGRSVHDEGPDIL